MHAEKAKPEAAHGTQMQHSRRPIEAKPAQYCTYHCGPLNPLICCQTGRPGRKPWRGSCVNRIEGKREKQKQSTVENNENTAHM